MPDIYELKKQVDDLQEQLRDFQMMYRESVRSVYDLDPVTANVIPLGKAKDMESHAKMLHNAVNTPRAELEARAIAPQWGGPSSGNSVQHGSAPGDVVNNYLKNKYPGPTKKGELECLLKEYLYGRH